jgi:hypothetical protein
MIVYRMIFVRWRHRCLGAPNDRLSGLSARIRWGHYNKY